MNGTLVVIPADLLEMLRCPVTRQPIAPASDDQLAALNAEVAAGRLCNAAGESVTVALDAALVRVDGTAAYPVRDGIPVLLADEALTFS